jgi:hypothetical protein
MYRLAGIVLIASALALPLGGCGSMGDFDPTEWFSGDMFGTKKKLPGDRKPVFPEGVPGVAQGIPPDLMKGNQPAPGSETTAATPAAPATRQAVAAPEEFKPAPQEKAKPKPKPKPKQATAERQPTPVTVRPQPQQQQQPPQQQQAGGGGQWPEPPAPRSAQPSGVQWPEPPAPRSAQPSGVQWPDPPPMR